MWIDSVLRFEIFVFSVLQIPIYFDLKVVSFVMVSGIHIVMNFMNIVVNIGMEAMTDRKMPNTIKMDTNTQMKIKNEFGPRNYFSFYN